MKVRRLFRTFEEYGWETPSWEIAAKYGLDVGAVVRLDTNASPHRPDRALNALKKALDGMDVNQYPDTSYLALREGLARYTGKDVGRFVVTNGADEGLDITAKVFLDPGDEVIVPTPTYSMYRIISSIMGASVVYVPRKKDFSLDTEAMLAAVTKRTKAIFLCNPNNPTANATPIREIEQLARRTELAISVDEAYFEYCGETALDLTDRLENVIVCRTLSKAFSMAGVRVGYLVAREDTVKTLNMVRPPNSLSIPSLFLGEYALAHLSEMRSAVRAIVRERELLTRRLASIKGIEPYPSETNFILFKVVGRNPDKVHERMMRKGLVLRNLSHVRGIENCLRTSVSTPQINARLVDELETTMSQAA